MLKSRPFSRQLDSVRAEALNMYRAEIPVFLAQSSQLSGANQRSGDVCGEDPLTVGVDRLHWQ